MPLHSLLEFLNDNKSRIGNFIVNVISLKIEYWLIKFKYDYINFDETPNKITPFFYNASEIVVLTSFHEGSPNVIKEAMSCNIPIVSTDVGDVKQLIANTDGCYITSYDPKDIAAKIELALNYNKKTTGRLDIEHLEESNIAKKIINIYSLVLDNVDN